ncbi:MAG TPA: hypothetical protein VMK12_13560 [Anaeromyxobacteraceae bacterium]|nr:hypothetical protein [Anaeromyxobacteraceae bacterium]
MTTPTRFHTVDVVDLLFLSKVGVRVELAYPDPRQAKVSLEHKAGRRPAGAAAVLAGIQARVVLDPDGHADVLPGVRALSKSKGEDQRPREGGGRVGARGQAPTTPPHQQGHGGGHLEARDATPP